MNLQAIVMYGSVKYFAAYLFGNCLDANLTLVVIVATLEYTMLKAQSGFPVSDVIITSAFFGFQE